MDLSEKRALDVRDSHGDISENTVRSKIGAISPHPPTARTFSQSIPRAGAATLLR